MSRSIIINILLFQLGWFACVLGGAHGYALLGSIVAMMIIIFNSFLAADRISEIRLIGFAIIIGLIFESIMTWQGLARYSHGQFLDLMAPFWMILMWPLFATTLNLSMRWLRSLAPLLVALLGALLAPLAYYGGYKLGAVEYDNLILSLSIIALAWAVLLPLMVKLSLAFDGYRPTSTTHDSKEASQYV